MNSVDGILPGSEVKWHTEVGEHAFDEAMNLTAVSWSVELDVVGGPTSDGHLCMAV